MSSLIQWLAGVPAWWTGVFVAILVLAAVSVIWALLLVDCSNAALGFFATLIGLAGVVVSTWDVILPWFRWAFAKADFVGAALGALMIWSLLYHSSRALFWSWFSAGQPVDIRLEVDGFVRVFFHSTAVLLLCGFACDLAAKIVAF